MDNPSRNIIIIEDHPVMRNGLAVWFAGTGRWQVVGTASGLAEAKELLTHNGHEADIVLLDIQLKDGSGLDIIPWFVQQSMNRPRPIIAIYSAFDDSAHVNVALCMGAQAYICKHRSEQELEAALLAALGGETYIDDITQIKIQSAENKLKILTKRETEVLSLVKRKLSNKEIAAHMGISIRTAENMLSCVYSKTGIRNRVELELL